MASPIASSHIYLEAISHFKQSNINSYMLEQQSFCTKAVDSLKGNCARSQHPPPAWQPQKWKASALYIPSMDLKCSMANFLIIDRAESASDGGVPWNEDPCLKAACASRSSWVQNSSQRSCSACAIGSNSRALSNRSILLTCSRARVPRYVG